MNIGVEFGIGDRADLLQNTNRQLRGTAFQLVNLRGPSMDDRSGRQSYFKRWKKSFENGSKKNNLERIKIGD